MQHSTTSGVRDRKRAATLRSLHDAAVDLTLRDGLAAATVSDIAERAGVSRRTFFNYYASKEDAVLGIQEPQIPPHAVEAFLRPAASAGAEPGERDDDAERQDRFAAALELTVTTMASLGPRSGPKVRTIVTTHPELIDRLRVHRDATQELLVTVLTERLAEQHGSTRAADGARALILLAGAVLRFAYGDDPVVLDDPDPAAIKKAMAAFRDALKEIQ